MRYQIIRTTEDDPARCQSNDAKGQCLNKSVEGTEYCPAHGGRDKMPHKRIYELKASKYQAILERQTDHEGIKSLRTEIGVLRMLMETRLNQINDDSQLLLESQSISNLVGQIEKLVSSCNKIELQLGDIITEDQAVQWIVEIGEIIDEYVDDSEIKATIASEIEARLIRIVSDD